MHVHTTASDGSDSPTQVVRKAAELGLAGLSITDHDAVSGLAEGSAEADRLRVYFIPGIELTADADVAEVHILGYHIDYEDAALLAKLDAIREGRVERAKEMVRRVQALGIDLSWEEVWSLAAGQGSVGRGQIFRAMLAKGLIPRDSAGETFQRYFSKDGLAYVEHYYLSPPEAVEMVVKAGGVPVLAHPGRAAADQLIGDLVRRGLAGIEAYYPAHDPSTIAHYLAIANRFGLIATGGTDYHGRFSYRSIELGTFTAPVEVLDRLREAAQRIRASGGGGQATTEDHTGSRPGRDTQS